MKNRLKHTRRLKVTWFLSYRKKGSNSKIPTTDKKERDKSLKTITERFGANPTTVKSKYFEKLNAKSLSIEGIEKILNDATRKMSSDAVYDGVKVYNTKAESIKSLAPALWVRCMTGDTSFGRSH